MITALFLQAGVRGIVGLATGVHVWSLCMIQGLDNYLIGHRLPIDCGSQWQELQWCSACVGVTCDSLLTCPCFLVCCKQLDSLNTVLSLVYNTQYLPQTSAADGADHSHSKQCLVPPWLAARAAPNHLTFAAATSYIKYRPPRTS
jgi:hypothetical protein